MGWELRGLFSSTVPQSLSGGNKVLAGVTLLTAEGLYPQFLKRFKLKLILCDKSRTDETGCVLFEGV
jgi:hypothetical protein